MNQQDVDKQINQMIKFIQQEAEETSNEISIKANEEFEITKSEIVEGEKKKIREEYERKEKTVVVQKKIANSNEIKACRLKVLKVREELLQDMLNDAKQQLKKLSQNKAEYGKLLKDLTLQAAIQLLEPEVTIQCRQSDKAILEEQLKAVTAEYTKKTQKKINFTVAREFLSEDSAGGIILYAMGDRIKVSNTLESRLELCYSQRLPDVRQILFGAKQ